ncbi:unnamed protein product [Ciceribacter sp. T2.26MG-112.2]|uniref:hypothetical protein n=1 Tax=Ciceribacter sp. T2.26MG-112.2 TaxID=3137154 RepID=UPI000E1632AE|nr:hypothetical protein [Ciceribacter naphthalenivorans]SSC73121.1 unnamed protein product [Ciceribacter naphthalenivorans]
MNITNFQEKPFFDSLPRYALPALQSAFDKAHNKAFSPLAIYNGLCRDFAEVGIEKPKQHVFNDWLDGIHKKAISRPEGAPIADEEEVADAPATGDTGSGAEPIASDDPARNDDALMMQRRVTQSGQLRIHGKYFKAHGAAPGTDVFVRPDPRDANRFSMFGVKDGKYVGEAICSDATPAEPETAPSPAEDKMTVGVDLSGGPDQSVTTVVTVDDGKPFFTPVFPAEQEGTLVERMIAEAKADLMRDIEARAKRLVAERLRLLAASIEGAAL